MPKIYTNEQKKEWVKAYHEGKSVTEICASGKPSKNSLYKWIKEYNGFITENGTEISGHRLVTLEQQNRHLTELLNISKVCPCNASSPREEKLRAVEKLEGQFSLHAICDYLSLPRGTYYNYKKTRDKVYVEDQKDEFFKPLIQELFAASGERFGVRPIRQRLKQQGYEIGERRIRRLMEEMGLTPFSQREVSHYYNPSSGTSKNRLKRKFTQTEPNKVWVSDFTYIFVDRKQYYLCVVMDLFSRKIVGYKLSDKADAAFVAETAHEAFLSRGKPKNLMFHSDSGIQYTSKEFFRLLKSKNITQSVSRPGTPLDNAVAESFFATFKKEELYHKEFHTYEELKNGIDEYILFYNQIRPHKKLKYVSPCEFEEAYYKNLKQK